jgi:hypothetical protein
MNEKHIIIAVAAVAIGYWLGKRQASQASQGAAAHNDTAGQVEQWWSYAGSWSV